jgi:hypothetical protein
MVDIAAPTYRVLTTNLLTNEVIGEYPFRGMSYALGLSAAGAFSGDVFVTTETAKLGLYEGTMPGKTGLYVLRDNECVWGGIIWAREYSVDERKLNVSASEFTSYFHHRKIWKTFSTTFGGTLTVENDAAVDSKIALEMGTPFDLPKGSRIKVIFDNPYTNLTSYFTITQGSDGSLLYINPKNKVFSMTKKQVIALPEDNSIATVKLITSGNHGLSNGDTVTLSKTGIARLDGTRTVTSIPGTNSFTVKVPSSDTTAGLNKKDASPVALSATAKMSVNGSVPPGSYLVSVDIRPDTFNFIKGVIESTMSDFTSSGFPNVTIEAGDLQVFDIKSYKSDGNMATVVTTEPHGLGAGQKITFKNLTPTLNKTFEVAEVYDDVTFSFESFSNPIPYTESETKNVDIIKKYTKNLQTTYTFSEAHSFADGDTVAIRNIPNQVETYYKDGKKKTRTWKYNDEAAKILGVPATNQIVVSTKVKFDDAATIDFTTYTKDPHAYAVSFPSLVIGTYGPYPYNSDIGITFEESDADLIGTHAESNIVRGFDLKTVADLLDSYGITANGGDGFDYRIECRYDPELRQFTRVFRFVPAFPNNEVLKSDTVISQLGADQLIFEYPGNISTFSLKETAEDAATRMFIVGNQEELSGEASQPYSAAALTDFLMAGWPILDASDSYDSSSDESVLYTVAETYLRESTPPIMDFSLDINGSLSPTVGMYTPGDWCSIIIDDEFIRMRLQNDNEPRDDALIRKIMTISVTVPDTSTIPESVSVDLVSKNQLIGREPKGGARNAFS